MQANIFNVKNSYEPTSHYTSLTCSLIALLNSYGVNVFTTKCIVNPDVLTHQKIYSDVNSNVGSQFNGRIFHKQYR